jgi:hypothetical protein
LGGAAGFVQSSHECSLAKKSTLDKKGMSQDGTQSAGCRSDTKQKNKKKIKQSIIRHSRTHFCDQSTNLLLEIPDWLIK